MNRDGEARDEFALAAGSLRAIQTAISNWSFGERAQGNFQLKKTELLRESCEKLTARQRQGSYQSSPTVLLDQNRTAEAVAELSEIALAIDPDSAQAIYKLSRASSHHGSRRIQKRFAGPVRPAQGPEILSSDQAKAPRLKRSFPRIYRCRTGGGQFRPF